MLNLFSKNLKRLSGITFNERGVQASSLLLFAAMSGSNLFAADVTLVSGFYQKESNKIDSQSVGSTSTISLGGRFSDDLTESVAWLGEANVKMRSYTAAAGRVTPDNGVGLSVGGGARNYFKAFTAGVVPYVSGMATIVSDKASIWTSSGYVQTSKTAILYGASAGIRAGLGGNFFVELDLPIFESPFFAVTKTETFVQAGTAVTSSSQESTETAIFVDSTAKLMNARLGLGMKL